jgi:DNA-binding Lrp family transcriptional regulator
MSRICSEWAGFREWRRANLRKIDLIHVSVFEEVLLYFSENEWPDFVQIPQEVLAERVGVTRKTVSKYLEALVTAGLLLVRPARGNVSTEYSLAQSFGADVPMVEVEVERPLPTIVATAELLEEMGIDAQGTYLENQVRRIRNLMGDPRRLLIGAMELCMQGRLTILNLRREATTNGNFGKNKLDGAARRTNQSEPRTTQATQGRSYSQRAFRADSGNAGAIGVIK